MAPTKRMHYTAKFKLEAVRCAEESNNSAAGREYGINEKLVRGWRKNKDKLKKMPKMKSARPGTEMTMASVRKRPCKMGSGAEAIRLNCDTKHATYSCEANG